MVSHFNNNNNNNIIVSSTSMLLMTDRLIDSHTEKAIRGILLGRRREGKKIGRKAGRKWETDRGEWQLLLD